MQKSYLDISSLDLFVLVKEQDDALAFEAIYNRYWFFLYSSAFKRLNNKEDAEEAVQMLFESLWENRYKIQIRTSLENYLFGAIRYIVLHLLHQRRAARPAKNAKHLEMQSPSDRSTATEEAVLAWDLGLHIDKLVESLPPKCRQVFELSRYEMMSHREIGERLGISEKTVENHIAKALRIIKANLSCFFCF